MAISAPARRMAWAQPQAIECSLATPTISAFFPVRTGGSRSCCCLTSAMLSSSGTQRGQRVPCDHQVLIGWHDMGRDAAAYRGDAAGMRGVGLGIELDAQPGTGFADHGP